MDWKAGLMEDHRTERHKPRCHAEKTRRQFLGTAVGAVAAVAVTDGVFGALSEEILLRPVMDQKATRIRYSMHVEGTLTATSPSGSRDFTLKSDATFDFRQRQFKSDSAGPFALRAAREFLTAQSETTVGGEKAAPVVLPQQSKLVHVFGQDNSLVQLSPEVRMTRQQLDLLEFPCDPLAVQGLLPIRALQSSSEKWNTDTWVVPMVIGIDATASQTTTCWLKSVSEADAVIVFESKATGADTGAGTDSSFIGEMVFNRKAGRITKLMATLREKRTPGPVSRGINVTARIEWTQEADEQETSLPATMPQESPGDRQLLLTLTTPWRLLMLHDRYWHVVDQTTDGMMLRKVVNGSLVGQCNLRTAAQVAAGSFTSEDAFLSEIEPAVIQRSGTIRLTKVTKAETGWRLHHVQATGKVQSNTPPVTEQTSGQPVPAKREETIIWDYYLCTATTGEQFSLVFSHAESDATLFDDSAAQMLSSLTIRSARPKVALPR